MSERDIFAQQKRERERNKMTHKRFRLFRQCLDFSDVSQPPQGREIIRSERTPEERNGEINQEEANKASQT